MTNCSACGRNCGDTCYQSNDKKPVDRLPSAYIKVAELTSRVEELERALKSLLEASRGVYSTSQELANAERVASDALGGKHD